MCESQATGCRAALGDQVIIYAAVGAANVRKHAADVKAEESNADWLNAPPTPAPEANLGMLLWQDTCRVPAKITVFTASQRRSRSSRQCDVCESQIHVTSWGLTCVEVCWCKSKAMTDWAARWATTLIPYMSAWQTTVLLQSSTWPKWQRVSQRCCLRVHAGAHNDRQRFSRM